MDYVTAYAGFVRRLETTRTLQEKINLENDIEPLELDLLFESMFLSAFRALENLLEDCFIYSMQGIADLSGQLLSATPIQTTGSMQERC